MTQLYCTAPWNGITVRENGDVKTCCVGSTVLGNLNNDSITEIIKSPTLSQIQNDMLSGKHNKNCHNCIQQEKESGLAALRQHYLNFYPNIHNKIQLKNLDIRWNNLCNLNCIYCSPNFSSSWQSKLNVKISSPLKNYQDELLDFILDNADDVNEIMLVGGEPMLMKQNYQLIKSLPKTSKISIITNMSYDLESHPCIEDLLNRPSKNTIWNISLENIGSQFEYVRNGASWKQIEKNLEFLHKHWPHSVSFIMVYSILNAFDMHDVVQTLHRYGFKKFVLQTYFGNPAFDVFSMPVEIRARALEICHRAKRMHYSNIHDEDAALFPMQNVDFVINKLESTQLPNKIVSKEEFYRHIHWCDKWNNTKFCDLWPHVIDLVDQHLK